LTISRAISTLRETAIFGLKTNVPFLLELLESQEFQADTHNLQHTQAVLETEALSGVKLCETASLFLLAKGLLSDKRYMSTAQSPFSGWRMTGRAAQPLVLEIQGQPQRFEVCFSGAGQMHCKAISEDLTGGEATILLLSSSSGCFTYQADGDTRVCHYRSGGSSEIWLSSPIGPVLARELFPLTKAGSESANALPPVLSSRLPATVLEVKVSEGCTVEADAVLLTLESMKMEHAVRSPAKATVSALQVKPGQTVEAGAPLLHLQYCTKAS
jgi:acetyl/propionyl-CoA carboxylase alpha subunit